ncbi:MAG: phosphomannose isomerase type II C-terminal cupin domain [Flavobacteriaceae bacterium]|nr:phosphomannose isomerase type II C-terminal cupin domain [Flavobacteriaceae bacterium]
MEFEERPWGRYYVLQDEATYKVKRIEVEPGQRSSYQFHHHRSEAWTMVLGEAIITLDDVPNSYKTGETILIPVGTKHRIENKSLQLVVFIEVQTGTYFGEDDIVRIEDDYDRL